MDVDGIRVAAGARSGVRPGRLRHGRDGPVTRGIAVVLAAGVLVACTGSPEGRVPAGTPMSTPTAGPEAARPESVPPQPWGQDETMPPVGPVPMPTVRPEDEPVPMPTAAPVLPPVPMPPHADPEVEPDPDP